MENGEQFVITVGAQMMLLLYADSLGIQRYKVSTTTLTLAEAVVEFGFIIYGAVVKRKASLTVGTEALDSTTVATIMLEWPVLVVRDCHKLAMQNI